MLVLESTGWGRKVERRKIGKSGVEVTTWGMGCAPLGAVGDRLSDEDADAILTAAWDIGIRYFDTAPLYGTGRSESRVGRVLSNKPRDDFVLSTKIGRLLVPSEGQPSELTIEYNYSSDAVIQSIESSLERLNLDRIDILLCHDIDRWTHEDDQPRIYEAAANGALPAMHRLREEGLVRAIGLGVNESAVCTRVMKEFEPDCFLLAGRFTLLEQEPLDEMLPMCLSKDVSVIIGGPYNSGILTNVERHRATYDYKPAPEHLWEKVLRIREICDAHSVDIRAAALQYVLRHPAVASVIPGMWRLHEVTENQNLLSVDIPESLWSDLANANLARAFATRV